jgi:N-acetylglucosaminyldiphosphoundecaprenol N-acetyl-beta-D-mannosaminyltransferase
MTRSQAADAMMGLIEAGRPSFIITANVHYAMLTAERPDLRAINDQAAFIVADGAPLVWASRLGPARLPERVAGSDLIYDLCERAARLGRGVYLLGGADGIADEAARRLQALYPGLRIVGTACPSPATLEGPGVREVIAEIKAARPDLLIGAFSQPKGELWLARHIDEMGVPACVQLGASFDFVAGKVNRAPLFFQKTGLEWAYRIYTDPARLAPRYAKNAVFLLSSIGRDLFGGRRRKGTSSDRMHVSLETPARGAPGAAPGGGE